MHKPTPQNLHTSSTENQSALRQHSTPKDAEERIRHQAYFNYMANPKEDNLPTLEEIKLYLRDTFLGLTPIPLSTENLAKSYGFFGGSSHKRTLEKILSEQALAFSLIPGMELISKQNSSFNLERLKDFICQEEEPLDIESLKQRIHIYNQKARQCIEECFQNPTLVKSALNAVSKKQWGQLLVKPPSNRDLLKATSKLSSEQFFKNGMHLAFLEIEPEIYGALKPEATFTHQGFYAKKHLRILLELEYALKTLTEKQLTEQKYKVDSKLYKKGEGEHLIQENEVRPTHSSLHNQSKINLDLPPERPSFIQQIIREELGHTVPVNRLQVQRILEAAEAILDEQPQEEKPQDFLHQKYPEPQKETITLESMDLSKSLER